MNSTLTAQPFPEIDTPLLAVAVATATTLPAALAPLDQATGGALGRALANGDFKGKRDETLLAYGGGKARRVLLVGMGKGNEVSVSAVRRAAAVAGELVDRGRRGVGRSGRGHDCDSGRTGAVRCEAAIEERLQGRARGIAAA